MITTKNVFCVSFLLITLASVSLFCGIYGIIGTKEIEEFVVIISFGSSFITAFCFYFYITSNVVGYSKKLTVGKRYKVDNWLYDTTLNRYFLIGDINGRVYSAKEVMLIKENGNAIKLEQAHSLFQSLTIKIVAEEKEEVFYARFA